MPSQSLSRFTRYDISISYYTLLTDCSKNVSADKALRDASNDAEVLVRDYGVESSMRIDVYKAKVNAEKNIKDSGKWEKLTAEEKRLVEKLVRESLRIQVHLSDINR